MVLTQLVLEKITLKLWKNFQLTDWQKSLKTTWTWHYWMNYCLMWKHAKFEKRAKKTGLPPGSLVYTGKHDIPTKITLIEYNKESFSEKQIEECPEFKNEDTVNWIKINGFSDVETLKRIGKCFNLHPLVLEDNIKYKSTPKVEDYDNYLYIVLKLFDLTAETR